MPNRTLTVILALCCLLLPARSLAQETPPADPTAQESDSAACEMAERLLDNPQAILGGGTLTRATPVTAQITAEDMGDRWAFAGVGGADSVTVLISESDLPLVVEVYRGVTRLSEHSIPAGGGSFDVPIPISGYYTLIVQRDAVADAQTGAYTLTLEGAVAAGLNVETVGEAESAGDWLFYARSSGAAQSDVAVTLDSASPRPVIVTAGGVEILNTTLGGGTPSAILTVEGGAYYAVRVGDGEGAYRLSVAASPASGRGTAQINTLYQPAFSGSRASNATLTLTDGLARFAPDAAGAVTLEVHADSLNEIRVDNAAVLGFATPEMTAGTGRLSFVVDNTAGVSLLDGDLGVLGTGGRYLYIQDYDPSAPFSNDNNFRSFALPDGRAVAGLSDETAWLTDSCLGLQTPATAFLLEGRTFSIERANNETAIQYTAASETSLYALELRDTTVERIEAQGGLVDIRLPEGYFVTVDRPDLTLTTLQPATAAEETDNTPAAPPLFEITDNLAGARLLLTDWVTLRGVEAEAGETRFTVADRRESFTRTGRALRTLEAREDTIFATWGNGSSTLFLGESDDFIEIDTPSGLVNYTPDAQPANTNNTGALCYTVNTAFEEFNCPRPVNPANGNLSFSITDLYTRGYRLDMSLTRTYNSRSAGINGPFGYGWNSDYVPDIDSFYDPTSASRLWVAAYSPALDVHEAPLGRLTLTTPSGSRHVFRLVEGVWRSVTLPGWSVEIREDALLSGWRVLRPDGVIFGYDRAGRIREIRHINGGRLTVTRESGELREAGATPPVYVVSDDVGRTLRLVFNDQMHIQRAELAENGDIFAWAEYSYRDNLLTRVEYSDMTYAEYRYSDGLLVSYTDPRAPVSLQLYITYDEAGRVCALRTSTTPVGCPAEGERNFYRAYTYENNDFRMTTRIIDEWGGLSIWEYERDSTIEVDYRLYSITDAAGVVTRPTYENGLITRFERGESGLLYRIDYGTTGLIRGLSGDAWTNFSAAYTPFAVDIDADGQPDDAYTVPLLSAYTLDPAGIIAPTEYTYSESGLVEGVTNGDVRYVALEQHPDFGLPTQLEIQSGRGETLQSQRLSYDSRGYLASREADGITERFTWDAFGRLTAYQRGVGGAALAEYTLTYTETSDGSCMAVLDIIRTRTVDCYDTRHRLISREVTHSGELLSQTRYTYDELDRLTLVTEAESPDTNVLTAYTYTGEGVTALGNWRVITETPATGRTVTEYDPIGRPVLTIDRLGQITRYRYEAGNSFSTVVTRTDPSGTATTFTYNRVGNLCSVDFGDILWELEYSTGQGQCLQRTEQIIRGAMLTNTANQDFALTFNEFTPAGQPASLTARVDSPVSSQAGVNTTLLYEYDPLGRVTQIRNQSADTRANFSYQTAGGLLSVTETRESASVVTVYDALNRPVRVESPEGVLTYTYTPDADMGRMLVEIAFGESTTWVLSYDGAGRLRTWTDENSLTTRYTYDYLGRLLTVTQITGGGEIPIAAYTYNQAGQVTRYVDADGRAATYGYNENGQLATSRDAQGVFTIYIYDAAGNLQTSVDALGFATSYDYDNRGRLSAITDPVGRQIAFSWGENGQLTFNNGGGALTDYTFDLAGRLVQITDANTPQRGVHTLTYGVDGFLSGFTAWGDGRGNGRELAFTYTPQGALASVTGADGETWGFTYDTLSRLTGRTDPEGAQIGLSYDRFGRLTGLSDGEALNRAYDYTLPGEIGLTDGAPNDGGRLFFDNLGRLLARTLPAGEGEEAGALVEIIYGEDGFTLTYEDGQQTRYTFANSVTDNIAYLRVEDIASTGATVRETRYWLNPRGELSRLERLSYFPAPEAELEAAEAEGRDPLAPAYTVLEQIEYNALGRPIRFIDGDNNLYAYTYDILGNLINVQFPDGGVYRYGYDPLRRLTSIVNPAGQVLTLTYGAGQDVTEIALNGRPLERYSYSAGGRLTGRTFADYENSRIVEGRGQLAFTYTDAGNIAGWELNGQDWLTIQAGRCIEDLTTQLTARFTYGVDGLLSGAGVGTAGCGAEAVNNISEQLFGYDSAGRLTAAEWSEWGTLEHVYTPHEDGYTLTTRYPDGQQVSIELDERLHIREVQAGDERIAVAYSAARLAENVLEVELSWGGRYTSRLRFNPTGQLIRIEYADTEGDIGFEPAIFSYTLNHIGLPLAADEARFDVVVGYDNVYRPTSSAWIATGRGAQDDIQYAFTLSYDAQGNRRREIQQNAAGEQVEILYEYDTTANNGESPASPLLVTRRLAGTESEPEGAASALPVSGAAVAGVFVLGLIGLAVWRRKSGHMPPVASLKRHFRPTRTPYIASLLIVSLIVAGVATAQTTTPPPTPPTTPTPLNNPPRLDYAYNAAGHVATITEGETVTTFRYDGIGRLLEAQHPTRGISTFTYDAFGRLTAYNTPNRPDAPNRVYEYLYDGMRLIGVRSEGESRALVTLSNQERYLLLTGEESSRWLLYDGSGSLRRTFLDVHTDASYTVSQIDVLGTPLSADTFLNLPEGLPIYAGMLYDRVGGIYVGMDGRAYDPLSGRFLQRDPLGPDATGNLYGYTMARSTPPAQIRPQYPFTEALDLLAEVETLRQAPDAESALAAHLPSSARLMGLSGATADPRLLAFNQGWAGRLDTLTALPDWLATAYNPPGVVAAGGQFRLWDNSSFAGAPPVEATPAPAGFTPVPVWDAALIAGRTQSPLLPPSWYDPNNYRDVSRWSWDAPTPQPRRGLRLPDTALERLAYPLGESAAAYADIFAALSDLPTQDNDIWLANIESAFLPQTPDLLPSTSEAYLGAWFTADTLPTWEHLRGTLPLPTPPGTDAPNLNLMTEG